MWSKDQGPAWFDRMSTCLWFTENTNTQLPRPILAIVPVDFSVSWKVVLDNMTWYATDIPLLGRKGRLWAAILSPSNHPILLMFWVSFYPSTQICINRQVLISLRNKPMSGNGSHRCAPVSGCIRIGELLQDSMFWSVRHYQGGPHKSIYQVMENNCRNSRTTELP